MLAPASDCIVEVKVLNAGEARLPAYLFLQPVLPGHEIFSVQCYSFLVENKAKNYRFLFDLGIDKRYREYPPALTERSKARNYDLRVERDVATQLKDAGLDLDNINAIIWSHSHFDHTGDPSTFPPTTELIFGPGTTAKFLPPFPERQDSIFHERYFKDRKLTELLFEDSLITIGGFKALDFFDDGSFYLLDVPGHETAHMAGLARATPTTFILLGADTCHHPGQFRPEAKICEIIPCPAALLEQNVSPTYFPSALSQPPKPLLEIPSAGAPSVHTDHDEAVASIQKIASHFDASPDVFIMLAHDTSLAKIVKMFPQSLNQWKEQGWKERGTWAFLDLQNEAFRFKEQEEKEG